MAAASSLAGTVSWVVGGVGIIGRGIAHQLLRAGSVVIVNSRFPGRLEALSEDLGHPEKLVCAVPRASWQQRLATVMCTTVRILDKRRLLGLVPGSWRAARRFAYLVRAFGAG